jgi:LDH2 family malate/lactate/ureidoglycolate dehydrogenase
VSAAVSHRYGFDELRRFAAALGTAAGLSTPRSLALASYLLWFDAAGAPGLGIATLPAWMEAIDRGEVDPRATGRVVSERMALAVFDGQSAPAPLALARAAELAVEKAREAAVGLVRVIGVGAVPSAAPVAAEIAIGPMAGWVLGPERCWSMAVPTHGGLPLVVDSGLSAAGAAEKPGPGGGPGRRASDSAKSPSSRRDGPIPASSLLEGFWLGIESLVANGGWLVAAASVPALAPSADDRQRLVADGRGISPAPGRLLSDAWAARRRQAQQDGVAIEPAAWKALAHWARRLSVDAPEPLTLRPDVQHP